LFDDGVLEPGELKADELDLVFAASPEFVV